MSGENSLQKSVQVRRLPGVQSRRRGGCWAILSEGFRPRPRALRRYAARRGEEAGDRGEGCPRTRATSLELDAASFRAGWRPRPRPRKRVLARLGPGRCQTSWRVLSPAPLPPAPLPTARPQTGVARVPRRGRALEGAPALSPSLTVSAAPPPGRDGVRTAQCPPPFAEGVSALSPPTHAVLRQKKAAPLAPLLRVPDRFLSTSAAESALRAAAAAGALTVGVVSWQWRRRLSPSPRSLSA